MTVDYDKVYDALYIVKQNALAYRSNHSSESDIDFFSGSGICGNFSCTWFELYNEPCESEGFGLWNIFSDCYSQWRLYSNDPHYPIPDPLGCKTAEQIYLTSDDMWVGEYGNLRMEFLNFLLQLTAKLKATQEGK